MRVLVREVHCVGLRHDVPDAANHHQQGSKGLCVVEEDALPA